MIDIIKIYNHKKDYIIRKHLSIHSKARIITNSNISNNTIGTSRISDEVLREVNQVSSYGMLFDSEESNTLRRSLEKCRRLLDLYG